MHRLMKNPKENLHPVSYILPFLADLLLSIWYVLKQNRLDKNDFGNRIRLIKMCAQTCGTPALHHQCIP